MHLKFTAKNIVSSLVEEQEKAIQRHGRHLARHASIICSSGLAKSLNTLICVSNVSVSSTETIVKDYKAKVRQ